MLDKVLFRDFLQKQFLFLLPALVFGFTAFCQVSERVSGKVTNEMDEPIPGVTVTIAGDTKGVVTDQTGTYSIEVAPDGRLVFSSLGMEPQTVPVNSRLVIDVKLKSKEEALGEVTVVAFGTQKKESVVGSITTVRPAELKVPSSNLTTALAGRLAGVIAYQRSGEPGADNANFFIRGVTSFGYSNNPLILVDGVEMTIRDLSNLQVDDIASFSILKDATATSLYGSRAANGVILISTKEGREGKANVSLRYEVANSSPTQNIRLADPVTYMRLQNESITTRDPLGIPRYPKEKIRNTEMRMDPLTYPAIDWHSLLFKKSTMTNRINLNVNGGGKVARYYVAASYNRDNGDLKVDKRNNFNNNIELKTYDLRSNVNINLTPTTEMVVRLNSIWTDYLGPIGGGTALYNSIMHTNPALFPAYFIPDSSNQYANHILFGNYDKGQYNNPYAQMVRGYQTYTNSRQLAQFEINQKLDFITEGLKLNVVFNSTRYSYYSVQRYYNPFYYSLGRHDVNTGRYTLKLLNPTTGTEYLNYDESGKDISVNNYFQGILAYNSTFDTKHGVGGTLVYSMFNSIAANAGTLQNSLPHRNLGLAGRLTYSYSDRYFIEGNFGYNGSERFSKDHRFGFFPSIGGAWYASNERFWSKSAGNPVSKLKLKATYGLVGNDNIGRQSDRFFFLSEVSMNDPVKAYWYGTDFDYTTNGVTETRYANPNITWETAKKMDLGLEMTLFRHFDINADVYREHRRNILLVREYIPATMGLQTIPSANVGEASSRGMDLSLDFNQSLPKQWFISGRVNFTYATSEFLKVSEPNYSATPWKSKIGQSLGQTWGYVADRLFVDNKEVLNSPDQGNGVMGGDIKYKDLNGDGVITELDMAPIGYPTTPEIVYGFGFSGSHKSIDLSFFFQGVARESFWIDPVETAPFTNNNALLKVYADDHWSEDNRNLYALWPRLSNDLNVNNTLPSTWFMRSGAFLRLKSVEVGYTLPVNETKKIGVNSMRVYLSGINLLTLSDFKLWDPEMGGNGLGYPLQKVINIGIKCSF